MAPPPRYSVLLPTYNERENLPLVVYMLADTFNKQCVGVVVVRAAGPRRRAAEHCCVVHSWAGALLVAAAGARTQDRATRAVRLE
jgi:hypothetical protein